MPRFARVVVPEYPHHITQRGNQRRDVFLTSSDRDVYLGLLRQYAGFYSVDVLGYCLMTNHVHLVLLPHRSESLAKLLREVQMRYSQYRHAVERGSGHLWQGRYYSCPVEPAQLGRVMRYVELNPVRANLVEQAAHYPWSSALGHLGAVDPLLSMGVWRKCWTPEEWKVVLNAALNHGSEEGAAIREATYGGRPLGSDEFVQRLEACVKRSLKRGLPGRPRKEAANAARAGSGEI
jgi:putative transposase